MKNNLSINTVKSVICEVNNVDRSILTSSSRKGDTIFAKHEYRYFAKRYTNKSSAEIMRPLNRSGIYNSEKEVENRIATNIHYKYKIREIKKTLNIKSENPSSIDELIRYSYKESSKCSNLKELLSSLNKVKLKVKKAIKLDEFENYLNDNPPSKIYDKDWVIGKKNIYKTNSHNYGTALRMLSNKRFIKKFNNYKEKTYLVGDLAN